MSIRPRNGSRSRTAPAAGHQQQQQLHQHLQHLEPEQDQLLLATSQSYLNIIGEHRYSWERALGSHSGASGARFPQQSLPANPMYSHDPRIAHFGETPPQSPSNSSNINNNSHPNNLNSPPQSHNQSQSQSHSHSHSQSHLQLQSQPHYFPTVAHARIVAGSNNLNQRSRHSRNINNLGQPSQQHQQQQNIRNVSVLPLNVVGSHQQQQQQHPARSLARAIPSTSMPPHSELSVRGMGGMQPSGHGPQQLREIGRKYPLWLPEYKRRAFNVSPQNPNAENRI